MKYGAKFVGRTLLSVATTLPEIAIVIYAAAGGDYDVAIGAGLGSNLLMMTLGLALMLLIATTRLSKSPLKGVDVTTFKLDKIFLIATAVISAVLFLDGYSYIDGLIFAGMFGAYLAVALLEMRAEKRAAKKVPVDEVDRHRVVSVAETGSSGNGIVSGGMTKAVLAFVAGTAGIFFGAEPFIHSLQGFSIDAGVSVVVLAVIISPIAGEMPEKISMMLLARKGAAGASIAVANVLGSKILNNTLLLAVAVFGAMYHGGFNTIIDIDNYPILGYQVILVTAVTIVAIIPMFKKEIGLKIGMMLAAMYAVSIMIQFFLLNDPSLR